VIDLRICAGVKNSVPLADLPSLIASVHASLSALGQPAAQAAEDTARSF
jgi:predicted transcriptional regulator